MAPYDSYSRLRPNTLDQDRVRVNCTLPFVSEDGDPTRWRWFGMLLTVGEAN